MPLTSIVDCCADDGQSKGEGPPAEQRASRIPAGTEPYRITDAIDNDNVVRFTYCRPGARAQDLPFDAGGPSPLGLWRWSLVSRHGVAEGGLFEIARTEGALLTPTVYASEAGRRDFSSGHCPKT